MKKQEATELILKTLSNIKITKKIDSSFFVIFTRNNPYNTKQNLCCHKLVTFYVIIFNAIIYL